MGTGLGNLFSNSELFSMAHDYGRMRNSGEFGTRECGRGYSWSLLQTKICKYVCIICMGLKTIPCGGELAYIAYIRESPLRL